MGRNWTGEQRAAIETHDRNLLVSAAAGSGKTAVLVARIIRNIENGADVERLVVVTFTKAAAAQMKERIATSLEAALENNPGDANLARQLSMLSVAPITTIDSFCLDLLKNYYMRLDLDPGFRVGDTGELELLGADVMDRLMEEEYSEGSKDFYLLVECFGGKKDDADVPTLINRLYRCARSYPWPLEWLDSCEAAVAATPKDLDALPAIMYLHDYIMRLLKSYEANFKGLLKLCQSEFGPDNYVANIADDLSNIEKMLGCGTFSQWVRVASNVEFTSLSRKKASHDVDPDVKNQIKLVRDKYKVVLKKLQADYCLLEMDYMLENDINSQRVIAELVRLSKKYMQMMDAAKREKNIIDFTDMELMARQLLVEKDDEGNISYTELSDELAMYYQEILVDEYQDSNMLQEQILTAISRGRLEPLHNNMFMVGDVKQSIYKFRLARPDLFIGKYDTFPELDGCECIELNKNFRSRSAVLYGINSLFRSIMKRECGGIEYDERAQLNPGFEWPKICDAQKTHSNADMTDVALGEATTGDMNGDGNSCVSADECRVGGKIKAYLVNAKGDGEERTARECEAGHIASIISEMVDETHGQLVYDGESGVYRPARLSDIVILVRSLKGFAREYADVLMNAGIPACVQSTGGYYDTFEIEQILNVLAIIDNPRQDIPLAAACVSYFGTLAVEQLARVKAVKRKRSLYDSLIDYAKENDDEISVKINEMFDRLLSWRRLSERTGIYDLIWRMVYDTGFYDYISHMPSGSLRTTNVDMFLEKAKSYGSTSYHGLFNFLRYIDRIKKYDIDNDGGAQDAASDMVRIMSIHKSKGLEFPIVIVAGMSKQFNMRDSRDKVVIDADLGVGVDCINPVERTRFKPYCKGAIETKLVLDSLAEEIRILYVAMTRAKERLVLVGTYDGKEETTDKWKAIEEFSYADIRSCRTYYDMVIPVAFRHPENYEVFEVTPGKDEGTKAGDERQIDGMPQMDGTKSGAPQANDAHVLPPYSYEYATTMKGKMSVSEIKRTEHEYIYSQLEDDGLHEECGEWAKPESSGEDFEPVVPQFINVRQPMLSAERGTAFHRVMECLDYDRTGSLEELSEQMEQMVQKGLLTERQRDAVDVKKIWNFCESDLGRRVKAAYSRKQVHRERPFVMGVQASKLKQYRRLIEDGSVTAEQLDEELILVQGVIDLYFEEDDRIVLVDYKTDRVKKLQELGDRYSVQLDFYAEALNRVSGAGHLAGVGGSADSNLFSGAEQQVKTDGAPDRECRQALLVREKLIYSFCLDDVLSL